jgi:hypothetical protein
LARVPHQQVHPYVERPIQSRDDGLWLEHQDALRAARERRAEQRQALARRVDHARTTHRQQLKLKHHAIAAMPISAQEKRKHYKALSFERKAAERKLQARIRDWRAISIGAHPGSWKQFLAAQAARGDRRAIRRLARSSRGAAIVSESRQVRALSSRSSRTSRGSIVHNLQRGIRLRESARSIELLGVPSDEALRQLVKTANERFGSSRVTLLGRKDVQRRLALIAVERGLQVSQERER